ncbi:hypothetical protein Corgl_1145 [Coriobacterium glomerans PW2]|uniref:Uncharacterized protein n=1 Tax=Coriobacterium glomerans (strain ATCC 49209 / DSM 20642 / JCM 10262 / PW2) TaxID=700015 RepID=F2N868_CORGP|nr:CarD family transcriptional regulator [Coriobacterium glomerans]AEB07251.1 hypothetical protein Corgl_1145 [Coriobacterium glomerans PW2]
MFRIGEHVIHPGQGVCTITGFDEAAPNPMIILESKQGHARTRMKYPLSQSDRLHATVSREEAERVMENYDAIECDSFTERNSSLEESHFKQLLKQGVPETLRVAKTMRLRIMEAESRDKKPSSYYTRVLKEAHRRSVEELAVALGVSESDIERRFAGVADIDEFLDPSSN